MTTVSSTSAHPDESEHALHVALLKIVDQLGAEYPHVPITELINTVDDARPVAVAALPNLEAYQSAVLHEARIRLNLPAPH